MDDLVGKRLGDFTVEGRIGEGGMGRVYAARQAFLDRRVALKVINRTQLVPGTQVDRFLREAAVMAGLDHPHIVPVHVAGEDGPYLYFAMKLIEGGTLADAMARGIAPAEALRWACQVGRALGYSHQQGIVHRDVKPTNILIDDGEAFLVDFGLALLRDAQRITGAHRVVGTVAYMAPEQARGEDASPASDCFALAVVLHEMLTGLHPVFGTGPVATEARGILDQIGAGCVAIAAERLDAIAVGLSGVFVRALECSPASRYADAHAMLIDLERFRRTVRAEAIRAEPQVRVAVSPDEASTEDLERPTAPPELGPGSRFGRYEIRGEIGRGGQGIVYEARDTLLKRRCAVKVLQAPHRKDAVLLDLFRNEACSAGNLDHPNVIVVFDYGWESGTPYLTMPLVRGVSLDYFTEARRPLPVPFCLRVAAQVADAIGYAHGEGIVHLDLKPANILIRRGDGPDASADEQMLADPRVVVTDFTLARWVAASQAVRSDQSSTTSWPCSSGFTPAYASPEQLAGSDAAIGEGSDYWALGVILYEMLAGRRPFGEAVDVLTRLREIASKEPEPIANYRPEVSQEIAWACGLLLSRDPASRGRGVEALMAASRALLIPAPPP